MALLSRFATAALAVAMLSSSLGPGQAQEPQAAPRTPMSPGSSTFGKVMMAPTERDLRLWGMNPPQMMQAPMANPVLSASGNAPNLTGLDTTAISVVAAGSADVVVSSRANVELTLQLYRPDQSRWQEYRLAPLANTPIVCVACGGKLKFSFNDGAQDSEINVEAPAMLRIFPDASGKRWQWDLFRLQAAAKSP
jgi:hypothetical protein